MNPNGQSIVETQTYHPRWVDSLVAVGSVMAWAGVLVWTIQGFDWQRFSATLIFGGLILELIVALWTAVNGPTKVPGLGVAISAIIVVILGTIFLAIIGVALFLPSFGLPHRTSGSPYDHQPTRADE